MKQEKTAKKPKDRYSEAKNSLLLVILLTAINIAALLLDSLDYFPFSIVLPYLLVDAGMYLCGRYPPEAYVGEDAGIEFFDPAVLWVTVAIAAVILALYLLCWLLIHRKRVIGLILALLLYLADTLVLVATYEPSRWLIAGLVIHAWILIELVLGILFHFRKGNTPETDETEEDGEESDGEDDADAEDAPSTALRYAEEGKARILLEKEMHGHHIVYRRMKRTNELMIGGKVYDEYTALLEGDHTLSAYVGGHLFEVGQRGFHSFLSVDGEELIRKTRWI